MTAKIDHFTTHINGEYRHGPLSNFYPWRSSTLEHFYQAAKPHDPTFVWQTRILTAETASLAKKLGRKCPLRPDWEAVKLGVMHGLLRLKFSDRFLQEWLINTGDAILEEGNNWGDTFWGVCNGRGSNHLGRLLMQVREEIQ